MTACTYRERGTVMRIARVRSPLIYVLALLISLLSVSRAQATPSLTVGSENVIYTQSDVSGLLSPPPRWPDTAVGTVKDQDGTDLDWYGSHGGIGVQHTTRSVGPYDAPLQTVTNDGLTITGIPSGTYNYVSLAPVYKDGQGNILGFIHLERWPSAGSKDFWASIGMAYSTDNGSSFQWLGEIVQPSVPFDANSTRSYEAGPGAYGLVQPPDDPTNWYFYVYVRDYMSVNSNVVQGISVSRAKVSTVIGNALNGNSTSFTKYYNGSFSTAGDGGLYTDLAPQLSGQAVPDAVQYNSTLGQYMIALRDYSNSGSRSKVTLLISSNPVDFNTAGGASYFTINDNASTNSVYGSLVGLDLEPETGSGNSFYVYYLEWPTTQTIWDTGTYWARRLVTVG